jgi:ribonucleotide reductase alpha subunit
MDVMDLVLTPTTNFSFLHSKSLDCGTEIFTSCNKASIKFEKVYEKRGKEEKEKSSEMKGASR